MIKINVHLIEAIVQDKKQNPFRYYVAAHLQDKDGKGWFYIDEYVSLISIAFSVKPKTVQNMIYKMVELKWGTIDKSGTRFFYISQDRLAQQLYVIDYSKHAAKLDWEHLGRVKDIRATLYAAILANKKEEKTIARATIQQLTGHARRTQRKYEDHLCIRKRFNYAVLEEYKGDPDQLRDKMYEECPGVFVAYVPNMPKPQLVRQIPNSYMSPVKLGKRQYSDPGIKRGSGNHKRIYFTNGEKLRQISGTCYIQSEGYEKLWFKINP